MPPRREPVAKPIAFQMIYQFNKLKPPKFGVRLTLLHTSKSV